MQFTPESYVINQGLKVWSRRISECCCSHAAHVLQQFTLEYWVPLSIPTSHSTPVHTINQNFPTAHEVLDCVYSCTAQKGGLAVSAALGEPPSICIAVMLYSHDAAKTTSESQWLHSRKFMSWSCHIPLLNLYSRVLTDGKLPDLLTAVNNHLRRKRWSGVHHLLTPFSQWLLP